MTIYVVENYDTNELEAFEDLGQAATYVRKYYIDHLQDLLHGHHDVERVLQIIKSDLVNLESDCPFIEDTLYIHVATLHN